MIMIEGYRKRMYQKYNQKTWFDDDYDSVLESIVMIMIKDYKKRMYQNMLPKHNLCYRITNYGTEKKMLLLDQDGEAHQSVLNTQTHLRRGGSLCCFLCLRARSIPPVRGL